MASPSQARSEAYQPQPSRIAPGISPDEQQQQQQQQQAAAKGSPSSDGVSATFNRATTGQTPCFRNSFLLAIGSGLGITAIGMLSGRTQLFAGNWGAAASVIVGASSWEVCRRSRKAEQTRMRTIIQEHNTRARRGGSAAGSPGNADANAGAA
ncbi:unnamed protein product [Jaminaea pallidilutea]